MRMIASETSDMPETWMILPTKYPSIPFGVALARSRVPSSRSSTSVLMMPMSPLNAICIPSTLGIAMALREKSRTRHRNPTKEEHDDQDYYRQPQVVPQVLGVSERLAQLYDSTPEPGLHGHNRGVHRFTSSNSRDASPP